MGLTSQNNHRGSNASKAKIHTQCIIASLTNVRLFFMAHLFEFKNVWLRKHCYWTESAQQNRTLSSVKVGGIEWYISIESEHTPVTKTSFFL